MDPRAYLILGFLVFSIGLFGVLTRRNAIGILIALELMFNASNLVFVGFARAFGAVNGQVFALFSIAVTVAEVAVGLAIVILIFRVRRTVNADHISLMRG